MYKNILRVQIEEFNREYKATNKLHPEYSKIKKQMFALGRMIQARGFAYEDTIGFFDIPAKVKDIKNYQYRMELFAVRQEVTEGIFRFYVKDDNLIDFFKNTDVRPKEVASLLESDFFDFLNEKKDSVMVVGLIGQTFACTIICKTFIGEGRNKHLVTVLTDDMNYTFCIEDYDMEKNKNKWVFNTVINYMFYINAFPECVIDGVPNGVKKNDGAKILTTSEKIVSHTTVEHGFVRPHFRSGYFRHFRSDYFVHCKGQVRFIASTMVKGKAKTVLTKGGLNDESTDTRKR